MAQEKRSGAAQTLVDLFNPFSGGAGPLAPNAKKEGLNIDTSKGKGAAAAPSFHADDLINQVYSGLSPQQLEWVRNTLAQQGITEKSTAADFHKGATSLASQYSGLQDYLTGNKLFNQGGAGGGGKVDPLAQQLFMFQTIAPYLDHIRQQTQSMTNPLYAKAQASIPAQFRGQMSPMISAMQGSEQNLQGALSAATAQAPALDALMQNVTADRSAQQRAYYESLAQKAAGTGAGSTDIAGLLQSLGVGQPAAGG